MNKAQLSRDLAHVLNCHNIDGAMDMPDFILGDMLVEHLDALIAAHNTLKTWLGENEKILSSYDKDRQDVEPDPHAVELSGGDLKQIDNEA